MRLVAGALAVLVVSTGCGITVDAVYLIDDGRFSKSEDQSRPLPQTVDRVEYETAVQADGGVRVACFARTRQVERTWRVTKTYRRRGGYDKTAYSATALLDALFGAAVAGTLLAICTREDADVSCWNMLWAAPFALDLGYSLIRYRAAKPAVLVDKSSSGGVLEFAEQPVREQATDCEGLASLWLGSATGPSDLQALNGSTEGADPRSLATGAIELVVGPARDIALQPEAAERWALQAWLNLLAVDRDGIPHQVAADRCALLRPVQTSLSIDARAAYRSTCTTSSSAATGTDGQR